MWTKNKENDLQNIGEIKLIDMNELKIYSVYPVSLLLKCSKCHHTFIIKVEEDGTIKPIDGICRKCSALKMLSDMYLEKEED